MVKDILIYITAFAAVIVIPVAAGRLWQDLRSRAGAKCRWQCRARILPAPTARTRLALGSALALFLYPHSLTAILSASSGRAIRRNAAMLPGYTFMLGLLALIGFFAIAANVGKLPEYAAGFKQFGNNFAVPALLLHSFPSWFVGVAFAAMASVHWCRRPSCRSPRPPLHTQYPSGVHQ